MRPEDEFSRLELNLGNADRNFRYFRSLIKPETKLLVLVKANAYGHGAVQFASMVQRFGADYLAVAYPIEGMELRSNGISLPIIVLTAGTDFSYEIIDNKLEPSIPNLLSLKLFVEVLRQKGIKGYPVHIKLDTGMHRLGFCEEELKELIEYLKETAEVRVQSVFSHLCVAEDPASDEFTLSQIGRYESMYADIADSIGYRPIRHVLNSAGIERFPQYQFDMVRLGIGIYGVSALPGVKLYPVASLKCKIIQIKRLRKGETVGYGRHGLAEEGTVIATIPMGYADGINRKLGCGAAFFSVNGQRVRTIGNICMDMCMLDITGIQAEVGDTVTIFGEDPSVCELASVLETIPYEIMTSVPRRIARMVVR